MTLSGAPASFVRALSRLQVRDRNLLCRLARARKRRDRFGAQSALHALLASHQPGVHALVRRRLGANLTYEHDVDDVVATTMERLVHALHAKDDFGGVPFGAVVARNADWAISEFWRRRLTRATTEALMAPSDLPESMEPDLPSLAAQLHTLAATVSPLTDRDQAMITERLLLGLTPTQIADRHGVRRDAVDKAYSRALAKLRRAR